MPTLSLLRGGPSSWSIMCPGIPDSCQLVSVEGLHIGFSFDPSATSSTVTVIMMDPEGSLTEDALQVESEVEYQGLYLRSSQCIIYYDDTAIWVGKCTSLVRSDDQVTLTLAGDLANLDDKYEVYNVLAKNPRDAACDWYEEAMGLPYLSQTRIEYTDDYYRSSARVATPAYTLGAWPEPYSYSPPTLRGYKAEEDDHGKYQKISYNYGKPDTSGEPWLRVTAFSPCPDGIASSNTGCLANPILWHAADTYMYFNVEVGHTDNPVYGSRDKPEDCSWLTGIDEYVKITAGRIASSSTPVGVDNAGIKPNETATTRVRDASVGEIIGQSLTMFGTGLLIGGSAAASKWFHTVEQGVFEASKTSWSSSSLSIPVRDDFEFDDAQLGRANGTSSSFWGAICNFNYHHPNSRAWHGVDEDCVSYEFSQPYRPVTIKQDPWTKSTADEACWLDGTAVYEGAHFWRNADILQCTALCFTNLYPENGEVFNIPLCVSTSSNLRWQQDNPLPKDIKCKYIDMLGRENEAGWLKYGPGTDTKDLSILQGSVLLTDRSNQEVVITDGSWSYSGYTRNSDKWIEGPGQLMDRYSGITYDDIIGLICDDVPTPGATDRIDGHLPNSAGEKYGFGFITETGNFSESIFAPAPIPGCDIWLQDYSVRDKLGVEYKLFGQDLKLTSLSLSDKAVLDATPLGMLKRTSDRVYAKAYRPTYTVDASMCFATVPPGTVLVLDNPTFDKGTQWLCLLLSKSFSSNSSGVSLTIAPMHPITDDDYDNWTNLRDVITHYTFDGGDL